MTKIKDLVDIKTGYAKYVNLVQEFNHPDDNRARMTQYMPIDSHREAFEKLTRALRPVDGRVYLLTGSYGTGKSHLSLMLANYLSKKVDAPEMVQFFENWAHRDRDQKERLWNARGDGRFLVALCEYGVGDDFEAMVLKAISSACDREGYAGMLDTHYSEAARQIDSWAEKAAVGGPGTAVFNDFREELARRYPELTLDALKEDLAAFSEGALKVFREIYRAVVDREFTYSKDNLVLILQDFLTNPQFKERYRGLAIIADEFGYVLDKGQISIDTFQRFAEMCVHGVERSSLIFVSTGHKPFRAYAGGVLSKADFSVVSDRVTEVPLESKGLEDIIAAVVIPNKDHPDWLEKVAPHTGMFNQFALACSKAGVFPHLKGPEFRERIIENIYPMHPTATHCVIKLSTEIGSNARSVFTFFSGEFHPGDGSYPWYVDTHDILAGDILNLYTADLLTTYFQNELRPENPDARDEVRQHIRNHRASIRELRRTAAQSITQEVDEMVERTLDLMLVYEIAGLSISPDNLAFGLYLLTDQQKTALNNRLEALRQQKVIFRHPSTGLYEFRPSEAQDFESMIETYLWDPDNQPEDLAQEMVNLVPLKKGEKWLEAKEYNVPFDEDKRLLRVFIRPGDLAATRSTPEGDISIFRSLEQTATEISKWADRYEGVAAYVICESDEEINRAKSLVGRNDSQRVIVGIPGQPLPVRDLIMHLRAAYSIKNDTDLMEKLTLQDRERLYEDLIGDETKGYEGDFIARRKQYLDGKDLSWYTTGGTVLVAQPKGLYDAAYELMTQLYQQGRNKLPHPKLNNVHVSAFGPGKNADLTDAINTLLRTHKPVEIDTQYGVDKGERRYLELCLAQTGALRQIGPAKGSIVEYQVESDLGKFRDKLPALAGMLHTIGDLDPGEKISVRKLIAEYGDPPYGQGPLALSLFMGVLVRTFGDSLLLRPDPTSWGTVTPRTADVIYELVESKHPNAALEFREITADERELINGIHNLFATEEAAAGQQHTIDEAYRGLNAWWAGLPNLARVPAIYDDKRNETARALLQLLAGIEDLNPYGLVREEIQTVYGFDREDMITSHTRKAILQGLKRDKAGIEGAPKQVKDALLGRLMEFFPAEGSTYGDYQRAIEAWYKTLDDQQLDQFFYPPEAHQAIPLILHLKSIANIETVFFDQIPRDAGFALGRADDWRADRSDEYVTKFESGLQQIHDNIIKLEAPEWAVEGDQLLDMLDPSKAKTDYQVHYRGRATLTVKPPKKGITVYLTNNQQDPTKPESQRQAITDKWECGIEKDSPVIMMASQSREGAQSRVIKVQFINEDTKYEIHIAQRGLDESRASFTVPRDAAALKVSLGSLIRESIGEIDAKAIAKVLREILADLERE